MSSQPCPAFSLAATAIFVCTLLPSIGNARSPVIYRGDAVVEGAEKLPIEYPDCPEHSQVRRKAEILGLALTQPTPKNDIFVQIFRDYRGERTGIMNVRLPDKAAVQTGDIYLISGQPMMLGGIQANECQGWTVFRGNPDAPHEDHRSEKIIKSYTPLVSKWLKEGACPDKGVTYRLFVNELGKVTTDEACLTSKIPKDFMAEPPIGGPAELIVRLESGADPELTIGPGKFSRSGLWHELTNPEFFEKGSNEESFLRLKLGQESPTNKSDAVRFLCEGYSVAEAEAFFKKRVPRTDEDANLEMVLCALNHEDSELAGRYVDHLGTQRVAWLREVIKHAADKKSLADTGWSADDYLQKLGDSGVDYASCAVLLDWLSEALVARSGTKSEDKLLAAMALYRANVVAQNPDLNRVRQALKYNPASRAETLPQWAPRDIKFGVQQYGRETPKGPGLEELRLLVAKMEQAAKADEGATPDAGQTPQPEGHAEKIPPTNEAEIKAEDTDDAFPLTDYYLVTAGLVIAAFGGGFLFGRQK